MLLKYIDQSSCMIHMMKEFHIQAFVLKSNIELFIQSILAWEPCL